MSIIAASRLRKASSIHPMFDKAVAYYRLDETTGDAIDLVNAYNGTLNGAISRDGEYYTFDSNDEVVDISDEDDFSFTDGSGNNTDFVIKTEVIFDGLSSFNWAWLVSKRRSNQRGIQEWQFIYNSDELRFFIWSSSDTIFGMTTAFIPTLGQKYILGVTLNGTSISLFIDGVIQKSEVLPNGFQFYNGPSKVELANVGFGTVFSLIGKLKETVIIKGSGWSQQNITDNYNNGNGITY
jgi:hypothetical protein